MRKAFTLIEMLVVITIAPLMMVVVSKIFATLIQDIPQGDASRPAKHDDAGHAAGNPPGCG